MPRCTGLFAILQISFPCSIWFMVQSFLLFNFVCCKHTLGFCKILVAYSLILQNTVILLRYIYEFFFSVSFSIRSCKLFIQHTITNYKISFRYLLLVLFYYYMELHIISVYCIRWYGCVVEKVEKYARTALNALQQMRFVFLASRVSNFLSLKNGRVQLTASVDRADWRNCHRQSGISTDSEFPTPLVLLSSAYIYMHSCTKLCLRFITMLQKKIE